MALSDQYLPTASRDPFYAFNKFQKDKTQDWTATPVIGGANGFLENNQDVAYNRKMSQIGIGQATRGPFAEWARKQVNNAQLGYQTALAENPTLMWQDYLNRFTINNMHAQWKNLTPQQRGENRSRYVGPVRTIADI